MQSFYEGHSLGLDVKKRDPLPKKRVRDDNGTAHRVNAMATENKFSANCGAGHRVNYFLARSRN